MEGTLSNDIQFAHIRLKIKQLKNIFIKKSTTVPTPPALTLPPKSHQPLALYVCQFSTISHKMELQLREKLSNKNVRFYFLYTELKV